MQMQGLKSNHFSFPFVLKACSAMGDLEKGKEIHRDAMMAGMDDHTYVCNWLRAMYARCGGLTDARQVFDEMPERDVISWNSMIAGYSQNDRPKEALELFHGMLLGFRVGLDGANISPNAITFVYVLLACAHVGLVDVARQWFQAMRDDHSLEPSGEHYACMVDALGRAGLLDEAMTLINSMPFEPGADVWGSLLGACRIHKDVSLAERAAERVFMLDPLNEG
ncbi:hypothetical protein AMTR_s00001p00141780 [Amborella trichopoda]|uniref:Pentacotripeptide-repeat region of PRORP domain-containing protein n=1 Tax=Amborella trichopoda TaxID=13333 RepID=W1NKB9_AMBTC|nr:hypothetical protein AMTR_s00001p00141780 [Amborella trichopoda]